MDTFAAVLAVVAVPVHDPAQRLYALAQLGAAGMVLESDQSLRGLPLQPAVEHDVSDHAPAAGLGHQVDEADAAHLVPLMAAVVVAEQLVAAADCQHAGTVVHRR